MWLNGTFELITPAERRPYILDPKNPVPLGEVITTKIAGTFAGIKDLDNDKIMEIIDGYVDSDIDPNIDAKKDILHQQIYKYNGTEYYLWKKVDKPYVIGEPPF